MPLHWEVRCTHCNAQAVVEAMIPFVEVRPGRHSQLAPVEQASAPISGFWEDYICPDHLLVKRREVWVTEGGPIDPEVAWDNYRNGVGRTTPVPHCPRCGQRLAGGQWIGGLPLHLTPHIELHRWLLDRWHDLDTLLKVQQHALRGGDIDHEAALSILRGEAASFNRFHEAMRGQLRLHPAPPPFEWYAGGVWPNVPDEWTAAAQELTKRCQQERAFLEKLKARQAQEHGKPFITCPICLTGLLYLYEYFAEQ